jgi:hypothetical protein
VGGALRVTGSVAAMSDWADYSLRDSTAGHQTAVRLPGYQRDGGQAWPHGTSAEWCGQAAHQIGYGEEWTHQAAVARGGRERVAYGAMPTRKGVAAAFIQGARNSTLRHVLHAT